MAYKLFIRGKERPLATTTSKKLYKVLSQTRNFPICVFGPSGFGKSTIIEQWAKDNNYECIIINLSMIAEEEIAGIPVVVEVDGKKVVKKVPLSIVERIQKCMDEGKKVLIFLDELGQATTAVMNTLYGICYPYEDKKRWDDIQLRNVKVVAATNLPDGTDGNLYVNDPPVPLLNRFHVYELVPNRKEYIEYLTDKWIKRSLPHAEEYIPILYDDNYSPRDIDLALEDIINEIESPEGSKPRFPVEAVSGIVSSSAILKQMEVIFKGKEIEDPSKELKAFRTLYDLLQDKGAIKIKEKIISTKEELIALFKDKLTEEEIASVTETKGGDENE